MPAIENQQTSLLHLVTLNGVEITEHGRTFSSSLDFNVSDVMLNNGSTRRYMKKSKNNYNFSFSYLPNSTDRTIDGRVGRDYLVSLMAIRGKILLSIKTDPLDGFYTTYVYADSYNESLIRRDLSYGCSYYNVNIGFREA
jgi:hypothetical protein